MVRRRSKSGRGTGDDYSPTVAMPDISPTVAYRSLVKTSTNSFRSAVEFQEKPRQVIFAGVMMALLFLLSHINQGHSENYADASRIALVGLVVSIVIYCMLQTKDGLMLRPHPILWRAIHGLTLCYFSVLAVLVVLPPKVGITAVHDIFPDISGGSTAVLSRVGNDSVISFDHLDCAINARTIFRQLSSIWFAAHVVGWWAKMCIFRDWTMCLTYSVAFELVELSLVWIIPEFQECWWDSIFMDVLGANMLGLWLGKITLNYLACKKYEWEAPSKSKSIASQFFSFFRRLGPFSWANYSWPKDSQSSWLATLAWTGSLVLEVNSFFLIHSLILRPSHWINPVRQLLLAAQGAQSMPELYEYTQGTVQRIGHNLWLMFVCATLECLLAFRYGRGGQSYGHTFPPLEIQLIFISFIVLWLIGYSMSSYRRSHGYVRSPIWLRILKTAAYIPLLCLTRNYAV